MSRRSANVSVKITIFIILCFLVYVVHLLRVKWPDVDSNIDQFTHKKGKQYELILWSSDFHISPVADIKNVLSKFGVRIIDKSLSGHCHLSNTCERDLRVINKQNGIKLGSCPNDLIRSFYDAYVRDTEMLSSNAILCTHAASMCELFMPFNKSLIVVASTRYEIGRHEPERWERWNSNLEKIARGQFNIVAANNRYDQEYIRYFTSIDDVWLLPSYCGYIKDKYKPTRPQILIAPARGVNAQLVEDMQQATTAFNRAVNSSIEFAHIRDLYPHFQYSDIAAHRAIVILPYQVSFMSLFEFYRMEVPMFVPSPELIATWHLEFNMLNERTWASVFGSSLASSPIPKHPRSKSTMKTDPNNDKSHDAVLEWVQLADFYQWPHIQQFSSWPELMRLVSLADLSAISSRMHIFNEEEGRRTQDKWEAVMSRVEDGKKFLDSSAAAVVSTSADEALRATYGMGLSTSCHGYVP